MNHTMPLQASTVYGPLDSRRFGKSLGINLLPTDQKVCSFNCVYCQYEDTAREPICEFPKAEAIAEDLKRALDELKRSGGKADWVMFSGNGEPTLHPDFQRVVDHALAARDEAWPGLPVGILSNSSTCYLPGIQSALMKLDGRFMKLDAGSIRRFRSVNRPDAAAMWGDVVCGLYHLPRTTLQSLFMTGTIDNTGNEDIEDWIGAVRYIQPIGVHIYTVDRVPQVGGVQPVPRPELEAIADRLRARTGISCKVF